MSSKQTYTNKKKERISLIVWNFIITFNNIHIRLLFLRLLLAVTEFSQTLAEIPTEASKPDYAMIFKTFT